jgi:hypothetical protein
MTPADQMSELASITYVDTVGAAWINPGDGLRFSFSRPENNDNVYRVLILRASNEERLDAVEFRVDDTSVRPIYITPIGKLNFAGSNGSVVTLAFGIFNVAHRLSEFRFFFDDLNQSYFFPSGRWVASNDSSGATLQLVPFDPNPTPQITCVEYYDPEDNGLIDGGELLRLTFSSSAPSGHHYSASMYYVANGGHIDTVDFVH